MIWMMTAWMGFIALVMLYNQEFLVFSVACFAAAFLLWKAWPMKEVKE